MNARGRIIYVARIGSGVTFKVGVANSVELRIPSLSYSLETPVTLVAAWSAGCGQEAALHRYLSPALASGALYVAETYVAAHPVFAEFFATIPDSARCDVPFAPGYHSAPGAHTHRQAKACLRAIDTDATLGVRSRIYVDADRGWFQWSGCERVGAPIVATSSPRLDVAQNSATSMLAEWLKPRGRRTELAQAIGVDASTVHRWRSGDVTPSGPARVVIEQRTGIPRSLWIDTARAS